MQLGHLKLSGYGLLSTQGVQNRSQKYSSVSQSGATAFPWRDPGPPAASRSKGVKPRSSSKSTSKPALAHPFPVKLQSVRYSAVHDDLKPPQTARRHFDLVTAHTGASFKQKYQLTKNYVIINSPASALGERYLFLASSSSAAYAPPH